MPFLVCSLNVFAYLCILLETGQSRSDALKTPENRFCHKNIYYKYN